MSFSTSAFLILLASSPAFESFGLFLITYLNRSAISRELSYIYFICLNFFFISRILVASLPALAAALAEAEDPKVAMFKAKAPTLET